MRHISEIVHSNERVLIVCKDFSTLSKRLSKRLEEYDVAIQRARVVTPSYERFNRIFFLNIKPNRQLIIPSKIKTTVILVKRFGEDITLSSNLKHIKYIILSSDGATDEEINQILWFSISRSNEQILDLRTVGAMKKERLKNKSNPPPVALRKTLIRASISLLVMLCLGFVIPLVPATFINIALLDSYAKDNYAPVEFLSPISATLTKTSSVLFVPARPIYALFSSSLAPEAYIRFNTNTNNYFITMKRLTLAEQQLMRKFSSAQLFERVSLLNLKAKDYLDRINTDMPNLSQLDQLKLALKNKTSIAEKIAKALPIASAIASDTKDQTLMVLITNNTRIRGTGGIIDTVGIIRFNNDRVVSSRFFSAKQLQPKQLNLETISPIIVTYTPAEATALNDATTSVDLFDAQEKLRSSLSSFLDGKRPTMTLLITTTAIQNILATFPELKLNNGKELVTSENFSIKQRMYGSNPTFISAVLNRMSDTLGTVNPRSLFSAIITSFNEKQLALLSRHPNIQEMLDGLYWSGKTISPTCISVEARCINDYFFSADQDLSSREGSSYIQKSQSKTARFINPSTLESTVRITWINDSPLPKDRGGKYKLYTQVLLPPNSTVSQVAKNNVVVDKVDVLSGQYYILGTYIEIEPKKTTELAITYTIPSVLRSSTNYQLITQKQLGSFASSIAFDFQLPDGYILDSTNIDAVVNGQRISYNDVLNTDKLFFVQIKRKP